MKKKSTFFNILLWIILNLRSISCQPQSVSMETAVDRTGVIDEKNEDNDFL